MDQEKIIKKQLENLTLDEDNNEVDDDFDASEADEEQFNKYMKETYGEEPYNKGYAFVFNFRAEIATPKTRDMVKKNLIKNFSLKNE